MPLNQPHYRSIASTLIRRIVLLAGLCLLAMTLLQAALAYHNSESQVAHAVGEIAENSLPMLSLSLWDIEPEVIQRQVNWLAGLPEIGRAKVLASTGQNFEAGALPSEAAGGEAPTHTLAILAPQGGKTVGQLQLWVDPNYLYKQILAQTLTVAMGYCVFTALLCLVVAWMLRRDLQRPLQQIARFALELKPQEISRPLVLDRARSDHPDEIDLVTHGFRQLQGELQSHIANLDGLVAERTQQLEKLIGEVHRLSITDALTGCFNRRVIEERLPSEIERARRYGRPLSVIFADIDHFKLINDTHGHPAGDAVLRDFGNLLMGQLRNQVDWVARYGGEEFLIVLPESDLAHARLAAERLREFVGAQPAIWEGKFIARTASFGVAQCGPDEGVADLLTRADAMLYHAKNEGRDRVAVSG